MAKWQTPMIKPKIFHWPVWQLQYFQYNSRRRDQHEKALSEATSGTARAEPYTAHQGQTRKAENEMQEDRDPDNTIQTR